MGLTQQEQPVVTNAVTEIPWTRTIFVGYILLLFASAFTRDFFVIPLTHAIPGIGAAFVEPLWKTLFWLAPTFLYVKFVLRQRPLVYLKLTTNVRNGILWGVGLSVFILALYAAPIVLKQHQLPYLPHSFDDWLNGVILVGVFEEIPFRGLIFQQLQSWMGFWAAALLSSLLFAAIHIPLWLATSDKLFLANPLLSLVTIFVIGVGLCYLLKRSGSLWSCILVHSSYDFSTFF